jgi:UDP-N-acetylmuramate-alanine ligase
MEINNYVRSFFGPLIMFSMNFCDHPTFLIVPNRLHERSMNDFDHLESFSDRLKTLRNVHETFMQTVRKVGRLGTSHNKVTL